MTGYPPHMTFRPLQGWPRAETKQRRRSNFSAPWSATLKLLTTELHMLSRQGGRTAPSVLQLAMREQDFRITDGLPRSNAVPLHPGVILNVDANVGPLSFPCDTFTRWQDNLRGIALGLEALRKLERYGIVQNNQQYTGWKALPGPATEAKMTADEALRFIAGLAGVDGHGLDLGSVPQAYRRARAATHPDRGGDRAVWDKVEQAGEVLRLAGAL